MLLIFGIDKRQNYGILFINSFKENNMNVTFAKSMLCDIARKNQNLKEPVQHFLDEIEKRSLIVDKQGSYVFNVKVVKRLEDLIQNELNEYLKNIRAQAHTSNQTAKDIATAANTILNTSDFINSPLMKYKGVGLSHLLGVYADVLPDINFAVLTENDLFLSEYDFTPTLSVHKLTPLDIVKALRNIYNYLSGSANTYGNKYDLYFQLESTIETLKSRLSPIDQKKYTDYLVSGCNGTVNA